MLFFRHTKQTSKNVVETTFKSNPDSSSCFKLWNCYLRAFFIPFSAFSIAEFEQYLLDGHQIEITWHLMLIFLTLNIYSTIGIVLSRLTWNVIYSLAHNSVHSLAQGKNEGNETLGPWTPLMPFLLTSNKHVPTELVHTNEYLFQIRLHLIVLFSRSKFYTSELFSSEFFSPQTCFGFQTSFDLKFRHNPESKKSWKSKIRKDQLLPNTSFINIWKVIKPCIP